MLIPEHYPVTCHTDHVHPGAVFVAIDGFVASGTKFINLAIERGATSIVLNNSWREKIHSSQYPAHVTFEFVEDSRKELALRSKEALGDPAKKLSIIGITGTKGKTTTTFLIEHILRYAGYSTALLGGVKNKIKEQEEESPLTTSGSDFLQMFFHECTQQHIDYVVMEVSSHSLALDRVYGVPFTAAGFTNLASEHMDFHPTLEHYFLTKMKLFDLVSENGFVAINTDDKWGARAQAELLQEKKLHAIQVGQYSDKLFSIEANDLEGLKIFLPAEQVTLRAPFLFGEFNAYNIVMAGQLCHALGVSWENVTKAIAQFSGVPGRLQVHTLANGSKAFVDYAHNPSSVEAVLKALRPLTDHLIVVFGCGGDRDKTKRPLMGALAAAYGDAVIITDDNPRNEDREAIIREIYKGIVDEEKRSVTYQISDRDKAIAHAVQLTRANSVIALLGKGHETYYLYKGVKYHFSDNEEIQKY